jgi:metal-responsive CopG/Arc/MetJ family transcriptional regulator
MSSERVVVILPTELLSVLDFEAGRQERTRSNMIRVLIRAALADLIDNGPDPNEAVYVPVEF